MITTFVRPGEGRIRLYLDSAKRSEWDDWLATGLFYGVTTNPTVLAAAGVPCDLKALTALVHVALEHGIHEVHVQTWGATAEVMIEHGKALAAINHRVVVKVPITRAGIEVVRHLAFARHRHDVHGALRRASSAHRSGRGRRIRRAVSGPDLRQRPRRTR